MNTVLRIVLLTMVFTVAMGIRCSLMQRVRRNKRNRHPAMSRRQAASKCVRIERRGGGIRRRTIASRWDDERGVGLVDAVLVVVGERGGHVALRLGEAFSPVTPINFARTTAC